MDKAKGAAEPGTNRGTTRLYDTTASKTLSEMGVTKGNQHVNSARSNHTTEQAKGTGHDSRAALPSSGGWPNVALGIGAGFRK
jgi:hypothetical protein